MRSASGASIRFALYTADVLCSKRPRKTIRIVHRASKSSMRAAEIADQRGILVRSYSRAQIVEYFARYTATTKQSIAETIARHVPALSLYVPPARKAWAGETRIGDFFEAAALISLYFHDESALHAA
jgi:hypothetical protein